jgi:hypothetical protein
VLYTGSVHSTGCPTFALGRRRGACLRRAGCSISTSCIRCSGRSTPTQRRAARRAREYFEASRRWSSRRRQYVDGPKFERRRICEWNRGIGELLGALASAGLALEFLHDTKRCRGGRCLDGTGRPGTTGRRPLSEQSLWRLPEAQRDAVPLMLSLLARKPVTTARPSRAARSGCGPRHRPEEELVDADRRELRDRRCAAASVVTSRRERPARSVPAISVVAAHVGSRAARLPRRARSSGARRVAACRSGRPSPTRRHRAILSRPRRRARAVRRSVRQSPCAAERGRRRPAEQDLRTARACRSRPDRRATPSRSRPTRPRAACGLLVEGRRRAARRARAAVARKSSCASRRRARARRPPEIASSVAACFARSTARARAIITVVASPMRVVAAAARRGHELLVRIEHGAPDRAEAREAARFRLARPGHEVGPGFAEGSWANRSRSSWSAFSGALSTWDAG